MSDLHGRIMNILVESKRLGCCIDDVMFANKPDIESMITFAYKIGHRDARHAAAEMSISVQAQRDELLAALKTYGTHLPNCAYAVNHPLIDKCTCGYEAASAEAKPCD